MSRINLLNCTFICAIILTITNTILGQESSFLRKPWPTYSLQNMPQTRFTCHDKILGGYYADPETQCQMFHVCVKVAGVGVQDFRFLCPNATAFDQEAQICADWGDVDCESSVLYYGSDNFDLYRLGSGFESKRAPLAEEDESTFHLQRAESGDVRRFKETRVDQKSRPDQPPNYTKHYETVTSVTYNNNNYVNTQQHHIKTKKQKQTAEVTKKPIVSYYTPTSTTTTTTTTERNYNDDSKQDLDDIFKGSHSSHFFSNRNGGREDDLLDHPVKASQKPNDFSDFSKKSESTTIAKSRVTPSRSKRPLQTSTPLGSTTTTTTASVPKNVKKVTAHSSYNTDFYDFSQVKSTTPSISTTKTTLRPSTQEKHNNNRYNFGNDYQTSAIPVSTTTNSPRARHSTIDQHNHNRFNFGNDYQTSTSASTTQNSPRPSSQAQHNNNRYNFGNDYQTSVISSTTARPSAHHSLQNSNRFNFDTEYETQAKIQPTTYNPNRFKSTTVKLTDQQRDKSESAATNKPTAINKKLQKFEQTQQKYGPQNSTFVNVNEFNEFVKIKPQEPQPFQPQPPAKLFEAPAKSSIEPQYQRSRGHARANNNQHPEPFRAAQRATSQAQHNNNRNNFGNDYQSSSTSSTTAKPAAASDDTRPRGFVSRGRINYKATTQRDTETYPTSTANTHKKFSTLVPKDKYSPTTFKPSTYKKAYDNTYYQSQQTIRPSNKPQKSQTYVPSSTTVYTTPNPYYSPDEDDGQYHPELYETDFPRNKLNKNLQRSSSATSTSTTTTTTQKPYKQNYQNPVNHLKSQQQTSFLKEQSADLADFSDEDELFKTAQSLNFGAASINKLRADIIKAEKTSQQYNSQYDPHNSITSPKTTTTSKPSTSTTTYFTYPSYSTSTQTTTRPTTTYIVPFVSTTTTTTTRPTPTSVRNTVVAKTTTTPYPFNVTKSGKHADKLEKKLKKNENKKKTSKRPPHADEDTSYDYAYYDSDTLSETPQEYPEYEIQEFTKTRKN